MPIRTGSDGLAAMAKTGDAFTFITSEDEDMVRSIERVLRAKVKRCTLDGFDYKKAAPVAGCRVRPAAAPTSAPHGTEKNRTSQSVS